jgi:hypothetical protein
VPHARPPGLRAGCAGVAGRPAVVTAGAVLAATVLAACGGGRPTVPAAALWLPAASSPASLATTSVATSPDGGIYRNPDRLDVLLVTTRAAGAVAAQLGPSAAGWTALRPLGEPLVVALRLRNDGKASSSPELGDLQVASDLAPPGTDAGPLRHYYHPTLPLAALSTAELSDDCSVRLDPGQSATVLLLYPPIRQTTRILWGRYGDFALELPLGGGVGSGLGMLRAVACTPPPVAVGAR